MFCSQQLVVCFLFPKSKFYWKEDPSVGQNDGNANTEAKVKVIFIVITLAKCVKLIDVL